MNESHNTLAGQGLVESMISLAGCSKLQRITVASEKSIELTMELEHRGYRHVAATANCGRPAEQCDAALADWRRRSFGRDARLARRFRQAIDRNTGARGLRSIMEAILLDTMFDLPKGVNEVMISQ